MKEGTLVDQKNLKLAVKLRHELHSHPELSMHEEWTKARLMEFLRRHTSLELVDRGRWFYAVHRAGDGKPSIAFRADMDAVPVDEAADLVPYASQCPGAGHKCGHDGHSAALAALGLELERTDVNKNVFLLFQHAEEIGLGAEECAGFLKENGISEIYAFHNLPGVSLGAVAVPEGVAQPASVGMILRFSGVKSHASYPENGRNPAFAIGEILTQIPGLIQPERWRGMTLATVIQVDVGERAFGTSAGYGELLLTIRGEFEEEMDQLRGELEALALEKAAQYGLDCSFGYEDPFPETYNHPEAAAKVRRAAQRLGIPVEEMNELFRASEDFGHYTKQIPGAIFYLGDGDHAPLHTKEFDFPDQLIEPAVELFLQLAREIP